MKHALAIVLGLLMLEAAAASASPCPQIVLQPKVMTPATRALAPGEGVVVSWLGYWNKTAVPFDVDRAKWRFSNGATPASTPPSETVLAPGLSVFLPDATATVFEDGKRAAIFRVTRSTAAARELPAPRIVSLRRTAPTKVKYPSVNTVVTVRDVPATAIALVAYAKDGKTAGSWGELADSAATIYSQSSCVPSSPNTRDWQPGELIRIAWIDAAGRVSKLSAPVKVVAVPER
ncbi:MAG: hypothetical protein H0T79_09050 [Deltaproteobacteria bacterium]|nr:hypothetical protein [Deltaproteobacteria bacterium]